MGKSMLHSGKCLKCEKIISSVLIEEVKVVENFMPRWKGVTYLCPHCHTVLGASIDPFAISEHLLQQLKQARRLGG